MGLGKSRGETDFMNIPPGSRSRGRGWWGGEGQSNAFRTQHSLKLTAVPTPGGGVLDFGLDGGVPPGPRDPNRCLEVKKVPMFREFAQKIDPCLGIFLKIFWARVASPENLCDFDEKWTHV